MGKYGDISIFHLFFNVRLTDGRFLAIVLKVREVSVYTDNWGRSLKLALTSGEVSVIYPSK